MTGRIPAAAVLALTLLSAVLAGGCRWQRQEDAAWLLAQAEDARRSLALEGELVTRARVQGRTIEARARVHRGQGRVVMEYTSEPVAGMKVIKQGGRVWAVSPQGQVRRAHSFEMPRELPPLRRLREDFSLSRVGDAEVAGRTVRGVSIAFKSAAPPVRIVAWLDAETHFPLATQRFVGDVLQSDTTYLWARYGVRPPPVWEPSPAQREALERERGPFRGGRRITAEQAAEALGRPIPRPSYLPEGLAEQGIYLTEAPPLGRIVHLWYASGQQRVVVSVRRQESGSQPRPGDLPEATMVPMGPVRAAVRSYEGLWISVTGSLEEPELVRIANSVGKGSS